MRILYYDTHRLQRELSTNKIVYKRVSHCKLKLTMKISFLIKKLREDSGMTLDNLARLSGLSKGFLSRLEKGDFDPANIALETLIKISGGLNTKVKDILDYLNIIDANEMPPLSTYLRGKYDISDDQDINTIKNIIM